MIKNKPDQGEVRSAGVGALRSVSDDLQLRLDDLCLIEHQTQDHLEDASSGEQ
jgi:hypothetical protein